MTIWRIHALTEGSKDAGEYMIKEGVIAIGQSFLKENPPKGIIECIPPQDLKDNQKVFEYAKKYYENYQGVYNIRRLTEIEKGDFVWMKSKSKYYLTFIKENLEYCLKIDKDPKGKATAAKQADAANQLSKVEWKEIVNDSEIPEAIKNSFKRGWTLQRVNVDKEAVFKKSKKLWIKSV